MRQIARAAQNRRWDPTKPWSMCTSPGAAPTLPAEVLGCEREVLQSQVKTWPLRWPCPQKKEDPLSCVSWSSVWSSEERTRLPKPPPSWET